MKAPYIIEGLTTLPNRDMGQYGIKITLDGNIARRFMKTDRMPKSPLEKWMNEEVEHKRGRVEFIEQTWFLKLIMLEPMSCSCFGISHDCLDRCVKDNGNIAWTSHNIDSPAQAAKLTAIWLLWFNHISVILHNRDKTLIQTPFCI